MRLATIACLLAAATATPSFAQQQPPYLDDRSRPAALVRSLYNAIARKEYARAWSYFAEPPAKTLEDYARGYEGTESVEVIAGTPRAEGTAGSIYYELPVAVVADRADGSNQVYSGCYTLRMADPTVGETFEPLHIERGALRASQEEFADALPRRCGDGPELPKHDAALETARALYARLDRCNAARMPWNGLAELEPEVHEIGFRYDFDDDDQPERIVRLFRFLCTVGAYNEGHAYFLADDDGEVAPLQFARPELDIRYADGGDETVESMTLIGFSTYPYLVNSAYDPETRTITDNALWRGMGDAASRGKWAFRQGEFNLVHYEVDASYDGEVNGEVVVDYDMTP